MDEYIDHPYRSGEKCLLDINRGTKHTSCSFFCATQDKNYVIAHPGKILCTLISYRYDLRLFCCRCHFFRPSRGLSLLFEFFSKSEKRGRRSIAYNVNQLKNYFGYFHYNFHSFTC